MNTEDRSTAEDKSNADKDKKAAQKLIRLYNVILAPTNYDACVGCLPCLQSGKLEDAKFTCVNGDCPKCRFDKLWSKGVRHRILLKEFDVDKGEWIEKLNPDSSLATDVWLNKVEWRGYEKKEGPSILSSASSRGVMPSCSCTSTRCR